MAQVPIINSWPEAAAYLEHLKGTVEADIRPLLDMPGGAPFAINREVLSYVDHLGHLYTGKAAVGQRSRDYLDNVLSKADLNYGTRAAEIYEMYRCGSIHEFEAKRLRNSEGQSLGWLCYRGERRARIVVEGNEVEVTHLEPLPSGAGGLFWLPVSSICLVNDLIASIDEFTRSGPEPDRVAAWNLAAQHLNTPIPHEFQV